MAVKFGDIDVGQIIQNEYRIAVLEKTVALLAQGKSVTNEKLQKIRKEVVGGLQKKYPNSGIKLD